MVVEEEAIACWGVWAAVVLDRQALQLVGDLLERRFDDFRRLSAVDSIVSSERNGCDAFITKVLQPDLLSVIVYSLVRTLLGPESRPVLHPLRKARGLLSLTPRHCH